MGRDEVNYSPRTYSGTPKGSGTINSHLRFASIRVHSRFNIPNVGTPASSPGRLKTPHSMGPPKMRSRAESAPRRSSEKPIKRRLQARGRKIRGGRHDVCKSARRRTKRLDRSPVTTSLSGAFLSTRYPIEQLKNCRDSTPPREDGQQLLMSISRIHRTFCEELPGSSAKGSPS